MKSTFFICLLSVFYLQTLKAQTSEFQVPDQQRSLNDWLQLFPGTKEMNGHAEPEASLIRLNNQLQWGQWHQVVLSGPGQIAVTVGMCYTLPDSQVRYVRYHWDFPTRQNSKTLVETDRYPNMERLHQGDSLYNVVKDKAMPVWGRAISHDQSPQKSESRLQGESFHRTAYWQERHRKAQLLLDYSKESASIELTCVWLP